MKRFVSYCLLFLCCFPTTSAASEISSRLYRRLIQQYAPVWFQEVGYKPLYDFLTRFDFDGDKDTSNNVPHAMITPLSAAIYGGVIAETEDSYYLFYGVYHVADYDKPLREFFFASAKLLKKQKRR